MVALLQNVCFYVLVFTHFVLLTFHASCFLLLTHSGLSDYCNNSSFISLKIMHKMIHTQKTLLKRHLKAILL